MFVSIGSTIGKVGQLDKEGITNQQINSLIAKSEFSNDFIFSLLEKYSKNIKRLAGIQAVPLINKTDFSALKFAFPSLSEQNKIANFFSLLDQRLQTQNKIVEDLKSLSKGLQQKIFSQQIRFKDNAGNSFPEWEIKKLGDFSTKKSSNISANKIEDNFGEYIIYGASGVLKKVDFYEEEFDFIGIVKDGAGVGRLFYCEGKSSVLGTIDIIKPKNKINTYFLYCILERINFKKYVIGSTIPHIYYKDYSKEKVKIPCLEEQTKIANFLSSLDAKLEKEKQLLEQYQQQKKFLLQNLFV